MSEHRSLSARIERAFAQRLFRLPHRAQIFLAGGKPRVIGDATLHPEIQLMLHARKLRGGEMGLRASSVEIARKRMRNEALRFAGIAPPIGVVKDLEIPGPGGPLHARHYAVSDTSSRAPLLVYFHGGGFALGDVETFDEPCRMLCHYADVNVLSVDYRLAPEHPFPAAVDDALAALRWAVAHAAELGADPKRVGVGGDSAGANLSTVVAQVTAGQGATPAFQLLIYPVTDSTTTTASRTYFGDGLVLAADDMDWFDSMYVSGRSELQSDPRVSPLLGKLDGLCPALVLTAELDPLRDEGEAYARALQQAGTSAQLKRFPGLVHGFLNMVGVSPAARKAVIEIAQGLRTLSRG